MFHTLVAVCKGWCILVPRVKVILNTSANDHAWERLGVLAVEMPATLRHVGCRRGDVCVVCVWCVCVCVCVRGGGGMSVVVLACLFGGCGDDDGGMVVSAVVVFCFVLLLVVDDDVRETEVPAGLWRTTTRVNNNGTLE
jgi:hypothetical protein